MTKDEMESIKKRLTNGWDMVMQISEKIGKEKTEWSLCDVSKASDILKDEAKVFKYLVEVESMLSDGEIEKY